MNITVSKLQNFILASVLFVCTNALGQIQVKQHIIQKGETLYRISVNYGVTVDQIKQYNPASKLNTLKIADTLNIPIVAIQGNTPNLRTTHKVKRKETLWSIAKEYNISMTELKNANPEMYRPGYQLEKGSKINIPFPASSKQQIKQEEKKQATAKYPVDITIILPFSSTDIGGKRCTEFYRGLLMAAEHLKNEGHTIKIHAYEEPEAQSSIYPVLDEVNKKRTQLIIGPLYFDHFNAVHLYSRSKQIKTLIPFSSKANQVYENPYIYLLNAPETEKYLFASDLFLKNFGKDIKAVFVNSPNGNEKKFVEYLQRRLSENKVSTAELSSDMNQSQILAACSKEKRTIFIANGSTDEDFKNIISKIVNFKKLFPKTEVSLFGYPEWQKFSQTHLSEMHMADTYLFTNAFNNTWSEELRKLQHKYTEWFHEKILDTTPRMYLLGYDTGLTFIHGLATYGEDFNKQHQNLPLLQSDISFRKISSNGGYINSSMWFIHYRPDNNIEKISEK